MKRNELKEKLRAGKQTLGLFSTVDAAELVEVAGLCGFDFTVIDCEHGAFSIEAARRMIMAAELRGITPLVRVTEKSPSTILRTLDIGAYGILAPDVESAQEAGEIVKSAKYYPSGQRGMAVPRAGNFGLMEEDYFSFANENTLVAIQCESACGLERLEEIAAVEGVDIVFIGPFDLSQSLGIPGQVEHRRVQEGIAGALDVIRRAGKVAGVFAADLRQAERYLRMGFPFVIVGQDIDYFICACRKTLGRLRTLTEEGVHDPV